MALKISIQGKESHILLYHNVERDFPVVLKFKLKLKGENNKYPYI